MTYDLKSLNQNEDSFQITPQKRVVGTHSMHLFEMFQWVPTAYVFVKKYIGPVKQKKKKKKK